MAKKMTVAFIGCGGFARGFVPLFKAHPYVEKVYVCDIIPERAREYSEMFQVEIIDTFEHAIRMPEITAVAIFTQRHLHGPLVRHARCPRSPARIRARRSPGPRPSVWSWA